MHLDIVSPDKNIFSGEVSYVQLPGTEGLFGVLENHAPIICTLTQGNIKLKEIEGKNNNYDEESATIKHDSGEDKEITFEINGGVVEVLKNHVIVLAE